MPDQMTCTVPPRIWTELPGGAGYVFSEGDAATTVTVGKSEIAFGAPMRWRPADHPLQPPRRSVFDTGDVEAYWQSRNNPEG